MKVSCPREVLLGAFQMVSGAVAARTTRPILANVKAIAQDDALVLMATDMEVGVRYEVRGVQVARAGAAVLPPSRLTAVLKETPDDEVTLDAGGDTTKMRTSTGRFELPGGVPDEFPDLPGFDPGARFHEATAGVLRTLIRRTAFAAEKKESARWAVTGVLWEADAGVVRLVATDTKRLAVTEGPADIFGAGDDRPGSHLVPTKAIGLLERNLTDDGEAVRVCLKPNEALFQTERALIHTKLVEGRFPPYRDIIPKKMAVRLTVPAGDLLARVKQAAVMADDDAGKRVDCRFEPGKLTLTARGAETGSGEVELALAEYAGPVIDIAFDAGYLTDMLRAVDGEPTVDLEMTDGNKPAVFRVGDGYTYLVMPLAG